MKKAFLLFSLLVVLAAPAMAAPRDDDPHGRGIVERIVFLLKRLVTLPLDDAGLTGPPRP